MSYRVPFIDPRTHYRRLKAEIDAAIVDCLSNGDLIYRRHLHEFEQALADFIGVKYCVGVNSGYHALFFSLLAAGVGPGDEVITVAHTFVATVSAIVHCGATPVLIDVAQDYNLNPELIERKITRRTKALLPVHLNGRMCDMDAILRVERDHSLLVIEDAAQALGATYDGRGAGSIGTTGCFSFYPFKILGGFGDGGAVATNDQAIARAVSLLRFNGEDRETGEYWYHGQTALLDNVQAAVLNVKLRHLPSWLEHRRTIAERYHRRLDGLEQVILPRFSQKHGQDVFQNYVIRADRRDLLREHLKSQGIETLVHWPKPMWEHRGLRLSHPGLVETETICKQVVSLPISAETSDDHVDRVVEGIREFYS
jgi:dTDP-4-amino-4,6-dideoxygalactose transaminase